MRDLAIHAFHDCAQPRALGVGPFKSVGLHGKASSVAALAGFWLVQETCEQQLVAEGLHRLAEAA
jgi:hypothetical protein